MTFGLVETDIGADVLGADTESLAYQAGNVVGDIGASIATTVATAGVGGALGGVVRGARIVGEAKDTYETLQAGGGLVDAALNGKGISLGDVAVVALGTVGGGKPKTGNRLGQSVDSPKNGVVYKRTDPKTGNEYVGQSKSDERFAERQNEHDKKLGQEHEYEILGREEPGKKLDVLEESEIRKNGGLAKEGGTLQNKRHQMSEKNYKEHGGTVDDPNKQ